MTERPAPGLVRAVVVPLEHDRIATADDNAMQAAQQSRTDPGAELRGEIGCEADRLRLRDAPVRHLAYSSVSVSLRNSAMPSSIWPMARSQSFLSQADRA